jgi:hypothetical protein
MAANLRSTVIVLDDNLADIELLATAWTQAGHDQSIGIHPCASCGEALLWLSNAAFEGSMVNGALVDLMLFDDQGRMAIDILGEQLIMRDLPVIAWSGIEMGKRQTDRMRKSPILIWKKPGNWTAYADFTLRLYSMLSSRSSGSLNAAD